MKVLVTGAGGYIGSQTCKLLKKQGHTVIVCDRRPITSHNYFDSQQNENCYGDYKLKMTDWDCDALIHIGATSLVGPSVLDPAL